MGPGTWKATLFSHGPHEGSVPKRVQAPTYLVHPIVQGHDRQVLDVFALLGALQLYQQMVPLPVGHARPGQPYGRHVRGPVGHLKLDVVVQNL